jgi:hypothetical protein
MKVTVTRKKSNKDANFTYVIVGSSTFILCDALEGGGGGIFCCDALGGGNHAFLIFQPPML